MLGKDERRGVDRPADDVDLASLVDRDTGVAHGVVLVEDLFCAHAAARPAESSDRRPRSRVCLAPR